MNTFLKIDHTLSAWIARLAEKHSFLKRLAIFSASELLWFLIGAMFATFAFYPDGRSWGAVVNGGGYLALMLFVPWLVTITIASFVRRKRPFQTNGSAPLMSLVWMTPSFPSGHATFAFALAGFAEITIGLGWFFFPFALLVALGRVACKLHYVSDVLAGAVVGLLTVHATFFCLILVLVALGAPIS